MARWQSFGGGLSLVRPVVCSFPAGSSRSSFHSRWYSQSSRVEWPQEVAPVRPTLRPEALGREKGQPRRAWYLHRDLLLVGAGGGRQGLTSTGQRPKPSRLNDNPPSDTGGDRVGPRGPLDHREPTSPPPAPPTAAWWRCIDLGGSGLRGPWGSGPGHAHPSDFLGGSRSISWGSAEVSFKVPGGSESPPPPPLFSIATPE